MRSPLPCLLLACAEICFAQTKLPAPQKVIDDYLRAAGGARAIARIRTQTIAGNLSEESSGSTGSWSIIAKAPDRLYTEIIVGSGRTTEAYNGMSPWAQDSPDGPHTLTGEAAARAEAEAREWNERLADVRKSKISLHLAGTENVRGHDAWHIQVIQAARPPRELYFDTGTHLIVRETLPGGQFDYDDYRPVEGIQTPFRITLQRGLHEYQLAVTRAEFNTPVDDSVFGFPRAASGPAPDVASLIHEVTRNQKAIDELQKQYTCHVTEEEDATDSKGRVKSKAIREFEVFNVGGDEVRRLVAKDGKPLAGAEKKKEDERFSREFEKRTKKAAGPHDPEKQKQKEEKEDAQISDFLRAVRFTNARRERFRGADVIAVDFGPNPDYKPKKLIENAIHQMSGVIWIDEQARDIARLEAHFNGSVRVGGGVAGSLEKGSSFVFEQARINDEVWLPTYAEIHLGGRFLFLKVRANVTDRYTDYKKFQADSTFVPEPN